MSSGAEIRVAQWYFGGLACTAAATCTHPLDLLKVHLQTAGSLSAASAGDSAATPTGSVGSLPGPGPSGSSSSTGALAAGRMGDRPAGLIGTGVRLVRNQGFTALYAGLTACWLKQLTYSTARFAFYEILKEQWPADQRATLLSRLVCSALAGAAGGLIGAPADMVNIRMQNDTKLPPEQRRK